MKFRPEKMQGAMGKVVGMADAASLDERLKEMAAAKAPKPAEEGMEAEEGEDELTADEVAQLRALLQQG